MINEVSSSKSKNAAAQNIFHPLSCSLCDSLYINNCRSVSSLVTSHSGWQKYAPRAGNTKVRGNTELILWIRTSGHVVRGEDGWTRRGLQQELGGQRLVRPTGPVKDGEDAAPEHATLIKPQLLRQGQTLRLSDDSVKMVPDLVLIIQQKVTKQPID